MLWVLRSSAKIDWPKVAETTSTLYFTIHTHQTMNISTHKNNLKIGKKTIRDGSLLINPKQVVLNKNNLMIKNWTFYQATNQSSSVISEV